jgi:hypothetical protein
MGIEKMNSAAMMETMMNFKQRWKNLLKQACGK